MDDEYRPLDVIMLLRREVKLAIHLPPGPRAEVAGRTTQK
jgi:hypothetical protein